MGFLDRVKKVAEQALEKAEQALDQAKERTSSGGGGGGAGGDARMGTPYVEGMLGRPGWRERGLVDPAAVLPIDQRDQAGVPHSTKSEIVEEPYGMGRRWTSGLRSLGLQLVLAAPDTAQGTLSGVLESYIELFRDGELLQAERIEVQAAARELLLSDQFDLHPELLAAEIASIQRQTPVP